MEDNIGELEQRADAIYIAFMARIQQENDARVVLAAVNSIIQAVFHVVNEQDETFARNAWDEIVKGTDAFIDRSAIQAQKILLPFS